VGVVLGLMPYHAAVMFTLGPGDYLKNSQRSIAFDWAATFANIWAMPLLFAIAGAASWFALGRRTPGRFARERLLRLGVPFVVGVFLLVPIQVYFGDLSHPGYHETYPQFYADFLRSWTAIPQRGVFGHGLQYWGHLWFIPYLLAVSIALLPLLLALRTAAAARAIGAVARLCAGPAGLLLLLGLPFGLADVLLKAQIEHSALADYSVYNDWVVLIVYAIAFVVGYVLLAEGAFSQALSHHRRILLVAAIALLAVYQLVLVLTVGSSGHPPDLLASTLIRLLRGYMTWGWIAAILGYAVRYLNVTNGALRYLNEASYPVYVLHMPILTALGYYLLPLALPLVLKYLTLTALTICATFAVYHFAVRSVPVVRVLFGMGRAPDRGPKIAAAGAKS
jgi:glucans biosynthesis protein C